jgi:hypothetical protein
MRKQRVECVICHKVLSARIPPGGDGSALYPRKHISAINANEYCDGTYEEGYYFGHPYAYHKNKEDFE